MLSCSLSLALSLDAIHTTSRKTSKSWGFLVQWIHGSEWQENFLHTLFSSIICFSNFQKTNILSLILSLAFNLSTLHIHPISLLKKISKAHHFHVCMYICLCILNFIMSLFMDVGWLFPVFVRSNEGKFLIFWRQPIQLWNCSFPSACMHAFRFEQKLSVLIRLWGQHDTGYR